MNILLVEYNPADAYLLMEFLGGAQRPHIAHVSDGRDAINYVAQRGDFERAVRPDVIVMDLGLPRINGYDALLEFKHDANWKHIPIIILTTSCTPLDRSQCIELGADAFFSKPRNLKGYEGLAKQLIDTEFPRLISANDGASSTASF